MQSKISFGVVELPVFTYLDEDMYVSEVPFIHVASQGKTVEESLRNLKEAVELYFEDEDVEKLLKEKFNLNSLMARREGSPFSASAFSSSTRKRAFRTLVTLSITGLSVRRIQPDSATSAMPAKKL